MKKFICLLLSVIMLGMFASCTNVNIEDTDTDSDSQQVFYKVYVDKNNGEKIEVYDVKSGDTVVFDTPTNNGYELLGWFENDQRFDLKTPITKDTSIVAQWATPLTKNLTLCNGNITVNNGVYTSSSAGIMADWNDNLLYGTLSAKVKATSKSDNGIIFGLHSNNQSAFWESGVSYYFFFVSQAGFAYLGKVNDGSWLACKAVLINDYSLNNSYNIKVVINGTDITCFVNDKIYIQYSEQVGFLSGGGYGIRSGAKGVTFTDFNVTRDII